MAKWGRADTQATKTIMHDDGENFIVVRTNLTKAEANRLMEHSPTREDVDNRMIKTIELIEASMEVFVTDWSVEDDDGNKIVPTIASYRELPASIGAWIDQQVQKEVSVAMGVDVEEAEGKPSK